MSNQVWILVAVVVIIAIIVAYQRSRQSQVRQTRDLRMGAQESRAQTPGDEISQREERRLTGMSAEDRDWEQASLQRNRDIQDERTRQVQGQKTCPRNPACILEPGSGGSSQRLREAARLRQATR